MDLELNERVVSLLSAEKNKKNSERNQKSLATAIGVPDATLSRWLTKDRDIPAKHVVAICQFFDVSPNFILGIDDSKNVCLPLDKVLAHYALGACLSSPSFYEWQNIPIEAPRNQIQWPKALKVIEQKAQGKLSVDRLNAFFKIANSYTHFEDSEYPSLEEYTLLRELSGKIERFDNMGGVTRDELADEFLHHLKAVRESDSNEYAAAVKKIVEG